MDAYEVRVAGLLPWWCFHGLRARTAIGGADVFRRWEGAVVERVVDDLVRVLGGIGRLFPKTLTVGQRQYPNLMQC